MFKWNHTEKQKFETKYFYDDLCLVKCVSYHELPTYLWRDRKAIFIDLMHQNRSHFIGPAKTTYVLEKHDACMLSCQLKGCTWLLQCPIQNCFTPPCKLYFLLSHLVFTADKLLFNNLLHLK